MLLYILKYLFLPPLANALMILAGLGLWSHHRRWGIGLVTLGLATLLILATPWASYLLRWSLEPYDPPRTAQLKEAQAIVVLGGGRDYDSPEFGWGDAPANATWRRLAYAAWLARQTGLPLLVSGGRVHGETIAEATLMAQALEEVFGLKARWQESRSRTTAENAAFSATMLKREDIRTVLLVSQAWHLPRAVPEFIHAGMVVIPAPTDFASQPPPGLAAWVPRAYHLHYSTQALHEWLGRAFYLLRSRLMPGY